MNDELPRRGSLDSLKKEAKRWLDALERGVDDAHARLARALDTVREAPTLRDVQHALAREHGFPGWSALKQALGPDPEKSAHTLETYEEKAQALLDAYSKGTAEALERHYALTWHRRPWRGMRSYVQLDLGKRPTGPDDDVDITIEDARYLIAIEHGFENWEALRAFVAALPSGMPMAAAPVQVRTGIDDDAPAVIASRDWGAVFRVLATNPGAILDAQGQMTDALLDQLSRMERIAGQTTMLRLANSKALTDAGIRCLSRMPNLRALDLSQTGVTDRGLEVLRGLPALESLSLVMTAVTDAGLAHLAGCHELRHVNLAWTRTGDGAIRALAGKPRLSHFQSSEYITDAGLAMLHDFPVFATWHGGEETMGLLSYDTSPNQLLLRGPFTDRGMEALRGLDGLFGLNLDDSKLGLTARALAPLVSLPHLGWLAVDARDDWMPYIAEMPALRFLGAQDTVAGDDGFVALSKSRSIEMIWGRRCHNLRTRGFMALSRMPKLSGLSVSCLNVEDAGIATLPDFPALRELMPMDIPDAGYAHIGRCRDLEALTMMYCRNTTDAATEHITGLSKLTRYFNSYTTITDRTPEILSTMDSLEEVTLDGCHNLTNAGVGRLARLPRLRILRVTGRGVTREIERAFPPEIKVRYSH